MTETLIFAGRDHVYVDAGVRPAVFKHFCRHAGMAAHSPRPLSGKFLPIFLVGGMTFAETHLALQAVNNFFRLGQIRLVHGEERSVAGEGGVVADVLPRSYRR